MGVFDRWRRGPSTGGDLVLERLAAATGGAQSYTFSYAEVDVLAFLVDDPLPHVLYCTFGLSQVESSQRVAGTQTELTLRIPMDDGVFPPEWPAQQLARMARNVVRSGVEIEPGHYLSTASGSLAGFVFVADPILGCAEGPTGRVQFTYAAGLVGDDLERMLRWDPVKFAGVLGEHVPLGLTDPARAPLSSDPQVRVLLDDASHTDGSSIGANTAKYLDVDVAGRVDLDERAAAALLRAARYRLLFGKSYALIRNDTWLMFDPKAIDLELAEDHIVVPGRADVANELLAVFDTAPGTYALTTVPLTFQVIDPTT